MSKGGKRLDTRESAGNGGRDGEYAAPVKKRKRKRSFLKGLMIVLCVIVLLCLAGIAAWRIYVAPPDIDSNTGLSFSDGKLAAPTPNAGDKDGGQDAPGSAMKLRDGVYTVLLAGTFEDGNTDTLMVATLDTKAKKLDVLSIPRDTTTLWNGEQRKINSIYSRGGKDENGMQALQQEMSTLLGFKPNNYAMLKMSGFKKLVDTIDGVEFDIPMDMYHYDGKNTINLKKGTQVLDGDKALQLMRFRSYGSNNAAGVDHDDFGRIQMQQRFILAVFKQMTKIQNIAKIAEYVGIASESINPTDLETKHMLWFAQQLLAVDSENINFHTLPTKTSGQGYYENVAADKALPLINSTVNPYTSDIAADRCEWPQHK